MHVTPSRAQRRTLPITLAIAGGGRARDPAVRVVSAREIEAGRPGPWLDGRPTLGRTDVGALELAFRLPPARQPLVADEGFRRYARRLDRQNGDWFSLFDLRGGALAALSFALLAELTVVTAAGTPRCVVEYRAGELEALFFDKGRLMRATFRRLGLGERAYEARLVALSRYFGLEAADWE